MLQDTSVGIMSGCLVGRKARRLHPHFRSQKLRCQVSEENGEGDSPSTGRPGFAKGGVLPWPRQLYAWALQGKDTEDGRRK